jgi:dihydropteroate synthase
MTSIFKLRSGKILSLEKPLVMGIINVTPDSFYSKSRKRDPLEVLRTVEQMISEGVDIVDIGGFSTRPNAQWIPEEEEMRRVFPVIEAIRNEFNSLILSIDTFRSQIAEGAINRGVDIVNDVSGGRLDKDMFNTVAKYQVPYVLMHMRGKPDTMQSYTMYENLMGEIIQELHQQLWEARNHGINDIIIDPGFGFSKTLEQNYVILKNLNYLSCLKCPILVGVSRKSMAYKLLNISNDEALNATTVLNTLALTKGAIILRVHDVKEAKECIKIWEYWNKC